MKIPGLGDRPSTKVNSMEPRLCPNAPMGACLLLTHRYFSTRTRKNKNRVDLSVFMQVRASVKRFCVCASMRGWLDGSAWNYRLYPWKRMHRLEILEAHKIY